MTSLYRVWPFIGVNPSGDKIIFSVLGVKSFERPASDIFMVDLRNGVAEQVTKNGSSHWPSWLDDENIVFESPTADVFNPLNLINIKTREKRVLELIKDKSRLSILDTMPEGAFGGKVVIFKRMIAGENAGAKTWKLYGHDLQTNQSMEIAIYPRNDDDDALFGRYPFVSRASSSGKEIIFYKDSTFYRFDLLSKTRDTLFKEENVAGFAYDQSKIIISKKIADGKYRMAIKDLKKDKETIIIQGDKIYNRPRWSPSGKFIAYHAGEDVWIYDIVAKKTSKLTEGNMYSYTWVTDDELIIQRGRVELYEISRDGKDSRQIFPPRALL